MKPKRIVLATIVILVAALSGYIYVNYFRDRAPRYFAEEVEHFKYGSIGAEIDGYPYDLWQVLPVIFSRELPSGYESFGFIVEKGQHLPVGVSVRKYDIERVGFNCATCHTARDYNGNLIPGAPASSLNLQAYLRFLSKSTLSDRFNAENIFAALKKKDIDINFIDKLLYRYYIIPEIRKVFDKRHETHAWENLLPDHGPGRTDALNPWKFKFGILEHTDQLVPATVSFPSLWNQRDREKLWLHWDGNNNSLAERNLSAALAGGASETSLDLESIKRIEQWIFDLKAPVYPHEIDSTLLDLGESIYQSTCSSCHALEGQFLGESTAINELKTDPYRWQSFNDDILKKFSTVGEGYPWQFSHYRRSAGYANQPLDGVWARAPYLHNNSVPSLKQLLTTPSDREKKFFIGCEMYDTVNVGLKCDDGYIFDTRARGNSNDGHVYGTMLTGKEKVALIEYLKTL